MLWIAMMQNYNWHYQGLLILDDDDDDDDDNDLNSLLSTIFLRSMITLKVTCVTIVLVIHFELIDTMDCLVVTVF